MNNLIIIGVDNVSFENILFNSIMIVPFLSGVFKKSKSEITRAIKQGGIHYCNIDKKVWKTFTAEDKFIYGTFVFRFGKRMIYKYSTINEK